MGLCLSALVEHAKPFSSMSCLPKSAPLLPWERLLDDENPLYVKAARLWMMLSLEKDLFTFEGPTRVWNKSLYSRADQDFIHHLGKKVEHHVQHERDPRERKALAWTARAVLDPAAVFRLLRSGQTFCEWRWKTQGVEYSWGSVPAEQGSFFWQAPCIWHSNAKSDFLVGNPLLSHQKFCFPRCVHYPETTAVHQIHHLPSEIEIARNAAHIACLQHHNLRYRRLCKWFLPCVALLIQDFILPCAEFESYVHHVVS